MNALKYISIILVLLTGSLAAQKKDTTVTRNVTVEREYKPAIQDAGKVYSTPNVLIPNVNRATPTYSDFNYPLVVDFNIHTLPSAELKPDKKKEYKNGYASVGLGNYTNTYLMAALPIVNKPDMLLDATINHLASFSNRMRTRTNAQLSFDKQFKKSTFLAGVNGGHEYYNYYGDHFMGLDNSKVELWSLKQKYGASSFTERNSNSTSNPILLQNLHPDSLNTLWRFETYAGLKSAPGVTGFNYDALLSFQRFSSHLAFSETVIHTQFNMGGKVNNNRWGVDIDLFNSAYKSNITGLTPTPSNNVVAAFNPYYSIIRDEWNVRLGAKAFFSSTEGNVFNPALDIKAEWRLIPSYLSVYGGITGDYKMNTMNSIYGENPYVAPTVKVQNTFTPSHLFLGFKVKPLYNILLDAYMENTNINNQYFYVNQQFSLTTPSLVQDTVLYSNRFNVIYSDASLFKLGARLSYNYRDKISMELKTAYNNWSVDNETQAWNLPKWEGSFKAGVNINRYWNVSAQTYFMGERFAKLGNNAVSMGQIIDLNLGTSYVYNNWLTGFFKLNNILNSHYQSYYGYSSQGFNVLLGATLSF